MVTPVHRIDEVAGIAHLDLNRRCRTAVPEVVFAEGKTEQQISDLPVAQEAVATRQAFGAGHLLIADAQRVAQACGWPVRRVCEAALTAYRRAHSADAVASRDDQATR